MPKNEEGEFELEKEEAGNKRPGKWNLCRSQQVNLCDEERQVEAEREKQGLGRHQLRPAIGPGHPELAIAHKALALDGADHDEKP